MTFNVLQVKRLRDESFAAAVHESILPMGLLKVHIQLVPRVERLAVRPFIRAQAAAQFNVGPCSPLTLGSPHRWNVRIGVRGR